MKNSRKPPLFIHEFSVNARKIFKKPLTGDYAFKLLTAAFASSIFFILGLMVYELIKGSQLSIQKFGIEFLIGTKWDPAISQVFGALPLILGTLVTSAIALLIGVPISLGIGLALSEYAPKRFGFAFSFLVELLAAIPSVIYGLWGIFILIPFLRNNLYVQQSLLFQEMCFQPYQTLNGRQ